VTVREAADVPLTVILVGGSHLGSSGLSPVSNFAVLVSRSLRASLGPSFGGTRSVFHEGDLAAYVDALPSALPANSVPVLLPRNLAIVPMLGELRGAAARVRGGRPVQFRSAFAVRESWWGEAVRRVRLGSRSAAGFVWAAVNLALLPRRLSAYRKTFDETLVELESRGVSLVILATPIPLRSRDFPLAQLYQRAFARCVRARRQPGVGVADLFASLTVERHAFLQAEDPLHLTAEGHRRVARSIVEAILAGVEESR
jgi:hypothetical protein